MNRRTKRVEPPPPATDVRRGRLPPLTTVRAFDAVGRLGSMRAAAEDLCISHTVVSRHVRNLEDWLGARLVDAGARGVRLTREGEIFFHTINRAFDDIAAATANLRSEPSRPLLRLWCFPGLAARWIMPRLKDLQETLPGVEIVLRPTDQAPDFAHREADAEIRYAADAVGPYPALQLCRPRFFPVAAPPGDRAELRPGSYAELAANTLIHEESQDQWRNWFDAVGHHLAAPLRGPRLWHASMAVEAAISGQGIALANWLMVADDVKSGRLVELLDTNVRLGAYYLIMPAERWRDPMMNRLKEWLVQRIAETGDGTIAGS